MKLCSACLLGLECRYDGKSNLEKASEQLLQEFRNGEIIPVCPEQLGGLPTPRSGARICSGDGNDVLDGKTHLLTDDGQDVTKQFIKGAYGVLKIARDLRIREYIGAQKSPSCGWRYTQGGLKERKTVEGEGVTIALLKRNGISIRLDK
ncbi:MAG: DUF523 domain-containing protein [Nanoarchaeota archaeon]|nr:DUF523 domain-containing protein [Nanoarchaeota archaeon]MBU4085957.1 DUF523 domain-containing protein [Nanoarchaeota archaeon]